MSGAVQVKHFVGLDLGQVQDFTALAVVEQEEASPRSYAVRHLHRWPLRTPYPAIVEGVAQLIHALPLQPVLAIDATGVGRSVVGLFHSALRHCRLYAIKIVAGHSQVAGPDGPHIPKKELVSTLQVLLQSHRLRVAQSLTEAATLVAELAGFKAKVTADLEELSDWRQRPHDDLVLAVALAVWLGENWIGPYTGPLVYWPMAAESPRKSLLQQILTDMDREEDDESFAWWQGLR
jgi:hypothetical protein